MISTIYPFEGVKGDRFIFLARSPQREPPSHAGWNRGQVYNVKLQGEEVTQSDEGVSSIGSPGKRKRDGSMLPNNS